MQWHQQPHSRHRATLGSYGGKSPENPIDFESIRQVRYINRTARERERKKNIQKHTNSREATKPSIMSSTRTRNPPNLSPRNSQRFSSISPCGAVYTVGILRVREKILATFSSDSGFTHSLPHAHTSLHFTWGVSMTCFGIDETRKVADEWRWVRCGGKLWESGCAHTDRRGIYRPRLPFWGWVENIGIDVRIQLNLQRVFGARSLEVMAKEDSWW